MKLKHLFLLLLFLLFGVRYALGVDGFFVTNEQYQQLMTQIFDMQSSNKNMNQLLAAQTSELQNLRNYKMEASKLYLELDESWRLKFNLADSERTQWQNLYIKSENSKSLWKIGTAAAFVVGLVLGAYVSK